MNNATVFLTVEQIEAAHAEAKTEAARTAPKTLPELLAEEHTARLKWEAETVAFGLSEIVCDAGGPHQRTRPVTVAEARRVFDEASEAAGVKPENWKDGFAVAQVPLPRLLLVFNSLAYFHGGYPAVESNGDTFTVTTKGYAG